MQHRHILVTGATHGIGFAIAEKFLSEGFHISFCARNPTEVKATSEDWQMRYPEQQVMGLPADLSTKAGAEAFATAAQNALGTPDVLVNNAGVFEPGLLATEPEGQLERMMALNLYAPYYMTRLLLPHMKSRGQGHIFNMCSVASLKAYPQGGAYSITKYALAGFSDNLREELKAHGIRVTALYPGATNSRSWAGAEVPEERLMEAKDVAILTWAAYSLSAGAVAEQIILRPQLGDL